VETAAAAADQPADQAVPHAVLPATEMPQTVNPASGWFVNANNDPAGTALDGDPLTSCALPVALLPGAPVMTACAAGGSRRWSVRDRRRQPADRADVERMQADTVFIDAEFSCRRSPPRTRLRLAASSRPQALAIRR
jgi:penicillin amidase